MLALVARRILTAVPVLLTLALVLFALVSAAPPPPGLADEELSRRNMGLPVFLNVDPRDRGPIIAAAIGRIPGLGEAERRRELELVMRIGGAGLYDVASAIDKLPAAERARVARDLAPLAFRMGLEDPGSLDVPAKAVAYWHRAWDERGADLRPGSLRRALARHLADRSEPLYARQLRNADTALLPPLFDALKEKLPVSEREEVEALAIEAARRAGATEVRDRATLRVWWTLHRHEYVELDVVDRTAARLTDTRFGRWVADAVTHRMGLSWRTGTPVFDDLRRLAPITIGRTLLSLALAYALALPLAFVVAARRSGIVDRSSRTALVFLSAGPAPVLALVLSRVFGHGWSGTVVVLSLSLSATPVICRQARAAILDVATQGYVVAARARGVTLASLWLGHIGKNALSSILAFAAMQVPLGLGIALVVEEIAGANGLGPATMAALRARDLPFLMGLALGSAIGTTALLLLVDLLMAHNDPRVRGALAAGHGEE